MSALGHSDESKDGAISWKITGPAVKDGVEAVANFKVTVTDAKNVNTTSNGILNIEPAKPAATLAPAAGVAPATQAPAAPPQPVKKPGE